MTGRMPSEIALRNNETTHIDNVADEIKNQGAGWLFRKAGYDPVYAGKVHLPKLTPQDIGFDFIESDQRDKLADTCAEWIRQPHRRPFFLVASFINPHDICYMTIRDSQQDERERHLVKHGTIECQTLDRALVRPSGVSEEAFFSMHCPPLPKNFEPQTDEPEGIRQILEQWPFRTMARREWDEHRWREHRWAYARLTEMVDAQIGRVLEALRESGLDHNTVVIFTSDHGDMDSAHRMDNKITLYEEACRIPLIISQRGTTHEGTVNATDVVSNGLDLLPTLCDYAGIDPPGDLHGTSLRPLAESRGSDCWRSSIPVESKFGRAVVSSGFKYVLYEQGAYREQLYDLRRDPGETRNAAHDKVNQDVLKRMREEYEHQFSSEQGAR